MSARVAGAHTEVRELHSGGSMPVVACYFRGIMSASVSVPNVPAVIESRFYSPRIVKTTISGYATLKLSEQGLLEFTRIIAGMDRPVWVSDSSLLTGYERASITYGRLWFEAFRSRGGRDLVFVADWSIAIMAGRAMGLGFGMRIENTPTLNQALDRAQAIVDAGR
jgi:hypothetical protein